MRQAVLLGKGRDSSSCPWVPGPRLAGAQERAPFAGCPQESQEPGSMDLRGTSELLWALSRRVTSRPVGIGQHKFECYLAGQSWAN